MPQITKSVPLRHHGHCPGGKEWRLSQPCRPITYTHDKVHPFPDKIANRIPILPKSTYARPFETCVLGEAASLPRKNWPHWDGNPPAQQCRAPKTELSPPLLPSELQGKTACLVWVPALGQEELHPRRSYFSPSYTKPHTEFSLRSGNNLLSRWQSM